MMESFIIICECFYKKHFLTSAIVGYRVDGTTVQMLYFSQQREDHAAFSSSMNTGCSFIYEHSGLYSKLICYYSVLYNAI